MLNLQVAQEETLEGEVAGLEGGEATGQIEMAGPEEAEWSVQRVLRTGMQRMRLMHLALIIVVGHSWEPVCAHVHVSSSLQDPRLHDILQAV